MRHRDLSFPLATAFAVIVTLVFSSCQTANVRQVLPVYEPALNKADFQNVKTTAYTHTESDHRAYGARNALGGELHAAGPAIRRAENTVRPVLAEEGETLAYERIAYSGAPHQPFSMDDDAAVTTRVKTHAVKPKRQVKRATAVAARKPPKIGSAAADWSRWPAGTTFRLLSTGQMYRVEDYGWALSGRNTIDLYMPNQREMNEWGAREEPIQILHWGDPEDSLRLLLPRQRYKHVRRMVLELQGNQEEASALR